MTYHVTEKEEQVLQRLESIGLRTGGYIGKPDLVTMKRINKEITALMKYIREE